MLQEEDLPIIGWPAQRIKDWSREVWAHPWLFLPLIFALLWITVPLRAWTELGPRVTLILAGLLSTTVFAVFCTAMVRSWGQDEVDR